MVWLSTYDVEIASYLIFCGEVQGIHMVTLKLEIPVSMSIVLVCVHKHDFRLK